MATNNRERLELATEMARQGRLDWQIVKATGLTMAQAREVMARVGRRKK